MNWWQKQFSMPKSNRYARFGLFVFVGVLFVSLTVNYFVFWGSKNIEYNLNGKNSYISLFTPQERVQDKTCQEGDCYQIFGKEPIYFKLLTTTNFDQGEVELTFKTIDQPIIELGVASGLPVSANVLYPVKNQVLQDLVISDEWTVIQKDNLYLLQKENSFENIDDFLNNLPYEKSIASYNFDLTYDFKVNDYQALIERQSHQVFSQGSTNFYTYIDQEDLDWTFHLADLNLLEGDDEAKIIVYPASSQEKLFEIKIDDDGKEQGAEFTDELVEQVKLTDLATGVYHVELIASEDIVIKEIESAQSKIVFDHKVKFLPQDIIEQNWPELKLEALKLYTFSNEVNFQSFHADSLQAVTINNQYALDIDQRITIFKDKSDSFTQKNILIPKRGLLVQSNGLISFDEDSYFNFQPYNFRAVLDVNQADFDFIIARYDWPQELDDSWQKAIVTVDLANAFYKDRRVRFMLAMPSIESRRGQVWLTQMDFKLKK